MSLISAMIGWLLTAFVRAPLAYVRGIWFLVAHPILFVKFVDVYKRHQESIDTAEQIRDAGYYLLSRQKRRALEKGARKYVRKEQVRA